MSETTVVGHILTALRARGLYVEKIHGSAYQAAGIPDLIGFGHGFGFGIEVKDPAKKASDFTASERDAIARLRSLGIPCGTAGGCSKIQGLHIKRIIAAGGRAGVATSIEEAEVIIEG